MKGALAMEHLSLKRLSVEGSFIWDPERYERLWIQASLSIGAPLSPWGTWDQEGGSYTGDLE
jgi:hypothetical protein